MLQHFSYFNTVFEEIMYAKNYSYINCTRLTKY